jgi:hypothetical protein
MACWWIIDKKKNLQYVLFRCCLVYVGTKKIYFLSGLQMAVYEDYMDGYSLEHWKIEDLVQ